MASDKSNFTLYIEGLKIPFIGISIAEAEGQYPQANIAVPATQKCLKILPGSVVQVTGEQPLNSHQAEERGKSIETVLLFEGEVSSVGYAKEASGRQLTLSCTHLLNRISRAKTLAADSLAPQLHKEAQMIFVNTDIKMGSKTKTNEGTKNSADPKMSETFQTVNRYGGILFTVLQAIQDLKGGDMYSVVRKIWEHFNQTDFYFHILDTSYRLKSSILTFPNPQKAAVMAVTIKVLEEVIKQMRRNPSSGQDVYTLQSVLTAFFEVVRYKTITPAAPTGGTQFESPTAGENIEPIRSFSLPDLDTAPPAMCNVFFPDNILNFSYSRNFAAEPTRSITYLDWNTSTNTQIGKYGVHFLIPDLKVYPVKYKEKDSKGEATGDLQEDYSPSLTVEESYQGVRTLFSPVDGWFTAALKKFSESDNAPVESITNRDESPSFEAIRNEALKTYLNTKFNSSRSVNISTDWNPSRLVGVPGVIIDPGFPSLVGVVSTISTEISAAGSATSSVTFRAVRVVYDEDEDAFKKPSESLYKDAVSSAYNEIFPTLHNLVYDASLYEYNNIGRDVYTFLTQGTKNMSEGETTLETLAKTEPSENEPHPWLVNKNVFDSMTSAPQYDYSIFRHIRDSKNLTSLVMPEDMYDPDEGEEATYSKYMYLAIKALKNEYKALADNSSISTYINSVTYRNLTPFNSYLEYIQATNQDMASDYKNSVKLLSDADQVEKTFQFIVDNSAALASLSDLSGEALRKIKLDNGNKSRVPSQSELNDLISTIETELSVMNQDYLTALQSALDAIDSSAAATSTGVIMYTIAAGDTLNSIATKYNTTISSIININTVPGPAIQDVNTIFSGKTIKIPSQANSQANESIAERRERLKSNMESEYNSNKKALEDKLTTYKNLLDELKSGNAPEIQINADDLEALYRPYDLTRRAHIKIAFKELMFTLGDVNVTN